ncbi:MAG: type IV pilus twitching motility protein PilT [Deltaproteobacteria bacterium]|nr:type IV pilus twitching motility protein PilT [Deltaproteobacteria bacterium]MCL5277631.1 type IV pilus twitching motility protein PilT [Deltaproteobacteria bacterium]
MARIDGLLKLLSERKGSDLHLSVGSPPVMRVHGELVRTEFRELTPADLETLMFEIIDSEKKEFLLRSKEYDFAYEVRDVARFRINAFFQRRGLAAVCRLIPSTMPKLEDMGLPDAIKDFCFYDRGLVLVTGPTGSGKSTTLAAIIDFINRTFPEHILTLEDPIEFVHKNISCLINQRQIGENSQSFASALRSALREDPDVILVGEMRDLETISLAITAAETGHLVFGTLHTSSAAKTVDRIIDAFPRDQQEQIRTMLSESLKAVIAQQLIKTEDGKGRTAALEIMVVTPAISNLIREAKTFQIPSLIQTGKKDGMQMMDQSILDLLKLRRISASDAYMAANNKSIFEQYLPMKAKTER